MSFPFVYKERDKRRESIMKEQKSQIRTFSWRRLAAAQRSAHQITAERLRDTSVLCDSAHLSSPGPATLKCGSN